MNPDEDGLPRQQPGKLAHEVGQSLDDLSVHQIEGRIAALRAEIARLEAALYAKQAARGAAAAFFKL